MEEKKDGQMDYFDDTVEQSRMKEMDRMKKVRMEDLGLPEEAQISMRRRKIDNVYEIYRYDGDFGLYGLVHDWVVVHEIEKCLKAHGFPYPLPYDLPYSSI